MCLTLKTFGYSLRVLPVYFASCDFFFTFSFFFFFLLPFRSCLLCLFDVIFLFFFFPLFLFTCFVLVTFVYKLIDSHFPSPSLHTPLLVLHCPFVLVLGHISRC